ncbi:MAG: DUF3829 domain-containing protein [Methylophilaceae bacterium]
MKLKFSAIVLTGAVLLSTGCDKAKEVAGEASTQMTDASSESQNTGSESQSAKSDAYVKTHNGLIGMFYGQHQGLADLLESYEAQHLSEKAKLETSEPLLYLNTSMLRNALGTLKEAQAIKPDSKLEKLHGIGAQMLTNGDLLLSKGIELESYFHSKKYLEDGYAKAKAENAGFVKVWTQFNADAELLAAETGKLEHERLLKQIADEKGKGNLRYAAKLQTMVTANDVLDMFKSENDFKDKEKFKVADGLIAELEKSTADINTLKDKEPGMSDSAYTSTFENINNFIGDYRELKGSGRLNSFNEMVRHYNQALR